MILVKLHLSASKQSINFVTSCILLDFHDHPTAGIMLIETIGHEAIISHFPQHIKFAYDASISIFRNTQSMV